VRVRLAGSRLQVEAATGAVASALHGAPGHVGKAADTDPTHRVARSVHGAHVLVVGNIQHRHERLRRVPCRHVTIIMVALWNIGRPLYFCHVISIFLLSFFLSSPNLSGRRWDVYHTSTHGVALVRI